MSDSTLIDVHRQESSSSSSIKQVRASIVVLDKQRNSLHDTTDEIRKRRFSLRSHDSIASLVSMASLASSNKSWGGSSRRCFIDEDDDNDDDYDYDDSDYDSETTISEQDLASLASREDYDHEEDDDDSDSDDNEDNHHGDNNNNNKYASVCFELDNQACQLVQESWQTLQDLDQEQDDYKDVLGDTLLLCMMEIDPASRNALGISSFRSPRYGAMCRLLAEGLERIIHAMGASSQQQQQQGQGQEASDTRSFSFTKNEHLIRTAKTVMRDWKRQGVNVRLLVQDALVYSIQSNLPEASWSDQLDEAWQSTIVQMLQTLL